MKRVSLLCAVAVAAVMASSAKADTFNISFNGGAVGFSGSGVFDATSIGSGVYSITDVVSGSVTDPFSGTSSITAVSTFAGADNELSYPTTPTFDYNGFSFDLANGLSVNLFYDGVTENALRSDGVAELVTVNVTPAAVAATPEPNSLVLFSSATILALGDRLRRRATA